uniref:RNA helicase n=1 Tax=Gongylonema pulchrum TaxID=637853 RepID=A0A183EBQ6_9BILA
LHLCSMAETKSESRPSALPKLDQAKSMNVKVHTEGNSSARERRPYRGRGRGHWRGGGRGGRGSKRRMHGDGGPRNKRRRYGHSGTVDDFPFLLGGNSKDPLNLKSVKPEEEVQDVQPIDIIIPKNIHDPLNLRNVNKNRAKRL